MAEPDPGRAERAAARRHWPVARRTLDQADPPAPPGDPLERLAQVWPLTLDAWASSGRPLPDYPRHRTPGRVIRPGEDPPP